MSLLKNLTTDDSIANERDSLGGGGVLASDCYPGKVALAYISKSEGGALGLVVSIKTTEGREIRDTLWMTSGTAKGGKNYYEKDGQKNYLPGFIAANSLSLLTVGKEISDLDTEEKVVALWNKDAKAEVPTKVQMVTDLLGQEIITGLIKETVDKTQKTDAGTYVPTGETRDQNVIDKFFRASDRKTTAEIRAQVEEAKFIDDWITKWKGQVRNKAGKSGAVGTVGAPKAGAANAPTMAKPAKSLFG